MDAATITIRLILDDDGDDAIDVASVDAEGKGIRLITALGMVEAAKAWLLQGWEAE
jgi:hypothetical protein